MRLPARANLQFPMWACRSARETSPSAVTGGCCISRYRQRCAAMAEGKRRENGCSAYLGLEDACSSCDERRPMVREATAQYAARRSNVPPSDLEAYEQSEEKTIESETKIPWSQYEGEEPEEEEASEGSPERWRPPGGLGSWAALVFAVTTCLPCTLERLIVSLPITASEWS